MQVIRRRSRLRRDAASMEEARPSSSRTRFRGAGGGCDGGGGGGGGERVVECSSCRSCTAVAVADCVALGCCPCAVVSVLTLALVRFPWAVSRRCLRVVRRRRRVRADEEERRTAAAAAAGRAGRSPTETATSGKKGRGAGGEDELLGAAARMGEMSDKVWIEFYQIGQWGFGRLSFSGIKAWDWDS